MDLKKTRILDRNNEEDENGNSIIRSQLLNLHKMNLCYASK